jgi:hypothetical protein
MSRTNTDYILLQFFEGNTLEASEYQDMQDVILASMIHHAMQNDSFLPNAAQYLQPLVPKIMIINDLATNHIRFNPHITLGDAIFTGSTAFGKDNPRSFFYLQDNSALNDRYLNHGEFGIARLLFQLEIKTKSLKQRNETAAHDKAFELHQALRSAFLEYLNSNKGKNARQTLNTTWIHAINAAKPELEKHRGWSNFLVNMLLVIPTLGVFMLYAGYQSNGKNFLFRFVNTDSAHCIKKLEQIDKYTQGQ